MRHRRPVRRNPASTLVEDLDALAARIAKLEDEGEYFDHYKMIRPVLNRHLGHYFGPSADWINPTWSLGGNLYLVEGDYDNFNVISRTPDEDPDEPDVIEEVEEVADLDALRRYFNQRTRANPTTLIEDLDALAAHIAALDEDDQFDFNVHAALRPILGRHLGSSRGPSSDFVNATWQIDDDLFLFESDYPDGAYDVLRYIPETDKVEPIKELRDLDDVRRYFGQRARRNPPRRPPPPPSLLDFQLQASAVQQGLFAPSSYEAKPKEKPAPVVDERQVDLFGAPPSKKNPRRNPRHTHPDGRLIPVLGDDVYQQTRGFMGSGGSIRGVVVKGRGGTLRVKLTGYSGMMPTTDAVEGKTMPLTSAWTVINDPIHDVRKAEVNKAAANKEEIQRQAKEAVEDYIQRHGLIPASMDNITVGMTLVMPYSEGRWGTGDPQRIHVEEVTVEEIESRGFVYDGGRTSPLKGWYVAGARTMRENKGDHRYVRRAPVASRTGEAKRERRFRYTYDPAEATRTNLPARIGEKLRIPHKGVMGHYEVVGRLADDVVGVLHDETGHAMAITDVALRELARDIYRPAPGTTPEEDIRHRHEREDALPRSRYETLKAIIDASGIQDHDFAQADAAYHAWKMAGMKQGKAKIEGEAKKTKGKQAKKTRGPRVKRPPKPPPWQGGELDPFEADLKKGKHYSSLLEAFEHATRGARTWRDIEPAMNLLRDVPGFADARFPDDVYERHNQHEMELKDQDHTIDVDLYGATLAGDTPSDVAEAVFLASTTTPPGLQKPLTEEELAYMAREEAGGEEAGGEEAGDDLSLGF